MYVCWHSMEGKIMFIIKRPYIFKVGQRFSSGSEAGKSIDRKQQRSSDGVSNSKQVG